MKKNIRITVIVCLVWVAIVLYLTFNRYADNNDAATVSPEELREIGAMVYDEPVPVSEFELVDHTGEAFNNDSFDGKWSMLFFGFTNCPDICPLTMHELTGFYQDLEQGSYQQDTQVVMISVDPFRDDQQQIAEFMAGYDDSFLGVNGDFDVISRLASELFVAHGIMPVPAPDGGTPKNFLVNHSGNILLIDPQGQYRGFLEPNIKRPNILEAYQLIRQANS